MSAPAPRSVFVTGGPGREKARRLGLVTLPQKIAATVGAVEDAPEGARIVDVPAIRGVNRVRVGL